MSDGPDALSPAAAKKPWYKRIKKSTVKLLVALALPIFLETLDYTGQYSLRVPPSAVFKNIFLASTSSCGDCPASYRSMSAASTRATVIISLTEFSPVHLQSLGPPEASLLLELTRTTRPDCALLLVISEPYIYSLRLLSFPFMPHSRISLAVIGQCKQPYCSFSRAARSQPLLRTCQ